MSLIIYHNHKKFIEKKFTPEDGGDEEYYKNIGNRLILDGFKSGKDLKYQVLVFTEFIHKMEQKKMYKIKSDQDHYVFCILALWKLGIIDPDCPSSPMWIAPERKKRRRKKG